MSAQYSKYTVEDFDNYDCLKLSKRFYIVLLYVLRGYIVWLMSVTNMKDRVGVIQWIYPETSLFILSLISGSVGIFIVLIISLRRPDAHQWVKWAWKNCRIFIVAALLFDLMVNIVSFFYWQLFTLTWLIAQIIVVFSLIRICFTSERMKLNLNEFPEKLPE